MLIRFVKVWRMIGILLGILLVVGVDVNLWVDLSLMLEGIDWLWFYWGCLDVCNVWLMVFRCFWEVFEEEFFVDEVVNFMFVLIVVDWWSWWVGVERLGNVWCVRWWIVFCVWLRVLIVCFGVVWDIIVVGCWMYFVILCICCMKVVSEVEVKRGGMVDSFFWEWCYIVSEDL